MSRRNILIGAIAAGLIAAVAIGGLIAIIVAGGDGEATVASEEVTPNPTNREVKGGNKATPRPSGDNKAPAKRPEKVARHQAETPPAAPPATPSTSNSPGVTSRAPIDGIEVVGVGQQQLAIEGNELVTRGPAEVRFLGTSGATETAPVGAATDRSSFPSKMQIDRRGCSTSISIETDADGQSYLVRRGCGTVTFGD